MTTTTDSENQFDTDAASRTPQETGGARAKAADAYAAARERTSSALGSARQSASRARETTSQRIDSTPELALIGGLAIGALAAALLPKSRKEEELIGQYGRQINERAKEAARAAKDAGRGKLDELGINKEAAKQKLSEVAKQAGEAVKTSATAAAQAAKSSQTQGAGQTQPAGQTQF
jgi:hypothetical protein